MKRTYMHQLAVAFDQLLNAALAGWADETLSSRAWRCRDKRRWYITYRAIDTVFFWQDGHCRRAYANEVRRGRLPVGYREA